MSEPRSTERASAARWEAILGHVQTLRGLAERGEWSALAQAILSDDQTDAHLRHLFADPAVGSGLQVPLQRVHDDLIELQRAVTEGKNLLGNELLNRHRSRTAASAYEHAAS